MRRQVPKILLCVLWTFSLAQCGDSNSLSGDVKFTIVPEDPVVVNADFTLNPGTTNEVEVKAPWFLYRSRVENNSTRTLMLVTYTFQINNTKNGVLIDQEISLDPSVACPLSGGGLSRAYLAQIPSGGVYQEAAACDHTDIGTTGYDAWYIYGLEKGDSDFYSAEVTGIGWFVDSEGVPLERLYMTGYLTTQ